MVMVVVRSLQISCNIRNFVCREKNDKIKILSSAIKLCFVINVLNNKTISLAEYPLILANKAVWLSKRRYSAQFHRIVVNCF